MSRHPTHNVTHRKLGLPTATSGPSALGGAIVGVFSINPLRMIMYDGDSARAYCIASSSGIGREQYGELRLRLKLSFYDRYVLFLYVEAIRD